MDWADNEEQAAFRAEVHSFIADSLPQFYRDRITARRPRGLEDDWQGDIAVGTPEAQAAASEWADALSTKGWVAPHWPTEYGGGGMTPMEQFIYNQEMAEAEAPLVGGSGVSLLGSTLLVHGNEEQKQKFLPPTLRGEFRWAQGFSEPGAGSRPRIAADPRDPRRRRVHHQRPEAMDVGGAQVQLVVRDVPHEPGRAEAPRHLVPRHGHHEPPASASARSSRWVGSTARTRRSTRTCTSPPTSSSARRTAAGTSASRCSTLSGRTSPARSRSARASTA